MNTKRIMFWTGFVVVLILILWGLSVAMNKNVTTVGNVSAPAPVTSADHIKGDLTGSVTLVEYGDFQCPACEAYYPLVTQVVNGASTTLRFVFRHFPLPQHANAVPAAIASEAAANQGKFWDMYDLLFTNHTDWTELTDPTPVFLGYAGKIGLDVAKFTADLKDPALAAKVASSSEEGQAIGINQTPTFFVNGKVINSPQSYADFQNAINSAAPASAN